MRESLLGGPEEPEILLEYRDCEQADCVFGGYVEFVREMGYTERTWECPSCGGVTFERGGWDE